MEPLNIVKHALNSTIQQINKGDTPTEALKKTAAALDLNPNYIQRTGENLNVALALDHFKKHASDRAADYPIADTQEVIKSLFGSQDKTLEQKKAEWFPKVAEDIDYNKFLTNPKFKKTAAVISNTDAKNDSYEITFKGQYKKAQEYLDRMDRDLDELVTKQAEVKSYIEASFFNLVKGFNKEASARTPFHEFESQAYATHGDRAVPYLDAIYKFANISEERGKHDANYLAFTPCKELNVFNSLLKAATAKNDLEREVAEAKEVVANEKRAFQQVGYQLSPMAQAFEKAACHKLDLELDKLAEDLEKVALGDIGKSMVQDLFNQWRDVTTGQETKKPVFENSEQDNSHRKTILQELIMTDPILKKIDPKKIIAAYQQMLRLSPQLTKEKEVVRAKLREMTAIGDGSLHPTDANQLIDVNTNLMKQHQMLHQTDGGSGKDRK